MTGTIILEENGYHRVNRYIPRGKHASDGQGRVRVDWMSIETETRRMKNIENHSVFTMI